MHSSSGKYSFVIRPILHVLDLLIILSLARVFMITSREYLIFCCYMIASWLITATSLGFYKVYRFTPLLRISYLLLKQFVVFTMLVFAFYGVYKEYNPSLYVLAKYVLVCFGCVGLLRIILFVLLKKYRILIRRNIRRVVILGENAKTQRLKDFFGNPEYGYQIIKAFDFRNKQTGIEEVIEFVINEDIDEIYCSIAELRNTEISRMVDFAENNLKTLKFLPDNKEILSRKLNYQYYGITPILSLRNIPLDAPLFAFLKRSLDIVIALLVIVGVLWWLTIILSILIYRQSGMSVFFKQKRSGLDNKPFYCYKYRSMAEVESTKQVEKNDQRVTRIGKFIRKTSIDELPQFINVLKGEMSTVGPRPHPLYQTDFYHLRVDRFMIRHLIKPGITGLAQVSGYRGEVASEMDIKNRVRFDIFYIENWSILMDLRIMVKTIINAVKGDEKAY
ncbi:MAG TPA: exopolysaccharide biosynthesis polyprenyl glycosylphosphotransferase [Leeuwenhoekiella sp.]|nr:exopolysaccharide biosynthesis polyprenyl glycosylphosphotransferase [Leeuwenhoekiella sp.]